MLINELRIGNYVVYNNVLFPENTAIPFRVTASTFDDMSKHVSYKGTLNPVPLTTDWLLKFRFIENKKWFYKEKFLLGYLSTDDNLQCEWKFGGVEGNWNILNLKYVHQLQNLYFALTQKELEI